MSDNEIAVETRRESGAEQAAALPAELPAEPLTAEPAELPADALAGVKRALEAERGARKAAEKTAKELQRRFDEGSVESAGELEALKSELTLARAELSQALETARVTSAESRELRSKAVLVAEAEASHAVRPEAIYRLVKDGAVFDADGALVNSAELVAEARRIAPELFRAAVTSGGNAAARDEAGIETGATGIARLRSAYQSAGVSRRRGG